MIIANRCGICMPGRNAIAQVRAAAAAIITTTKMSTATNNTFSLEKLTGRSLIRVKGELSKDFLQSLVTNDINHLDGTGTRITSSLYTMFLNKNGRVLYDAIIYKPITAENLYFIECDREIDVELQKHLKIFRVRKKIDIDVVGQEQAVWAVFNPNGYDFKSGGVGKQELCLSNALETKEIMIVNDPRLKYLGSRIIAPNEIDIREALPTNTFNANTSEQYQLHRYKLGIAEGIEELPVAKCFPLESNCDYLHGVSFHKGCYLGQEFTARTHHTGVIRKRLMPIQFAGTVRLSPKSSKHVETTHGIVLGKVRGFCGDWGLGLLKFETALQETSALLFGGKDDGGVTGTTVRPWWWPQEAPAIEMIRDKQ